MAQLKKTKFEVATIANIKITLDLSFFKQTEELYFNATDIAKAFGKDARRWLENEDTQDYLSAILEEYPNLNRQDFDGLKHGKLVKTCRGRYGGTYLHNILALPFARWCSAKIAVLLDKYLLERIKEEQQRKNARLESLTGFRPLTDAIQETHEEAKHYHYSNEINMHYQIVTGKQAKQLRNEMGLSEKQRPIDYLPAWQVVALSRLRRYDETLIRMGLDYENRKTTLKELFNSILPKQLEVKHV